ncbi:glutamate-rich protein 2 isoform X2 [Hyaena hyaena]|uniref:glutamate-rich protein 2 isoform X2 n=1 Tax=Hyaena hyaena TaxID=95912 RepID=UPI0019224AF7|nr:glutamate-rich protein 2 isoform X2 [Hyaena hyaena]
MDNDIPIPFSAVLRVKSARPDVRSRPHAPGSQRGGTARQCKPRVSRPASIASPRVCSAHAPPPPCPSTPPYARSAPLPRPGLSQLPSPGLAGPPPARARHSSPGAARLLRGPQLLPQLAPPSPLSFRFPERLPELAPRGVSSPWRRRSVFSSWLTAPRDPRAVLAFGVRPEDGRCERTTDRFGLWGSTAAEAALGKEPKYRQNGRLLVFDPKAKVIEPNEAMSDKCLFGLRSRLASKLCTSPTQVSLNVARTISEKREVPSKNIEKLASLRNTENRASSNSIENKDTEINLQSKLWSSSFLKEGTGQVGKDSVFSEQEKNNEYYLQDTDDKLSESTDDDGEDDTTDDDNDEDRNRNKDTHAPLELMAEFLRAEMGRDYHLAKKLCQMKKSQNLEEGDEDSEEDSSGESEGESSEKLSEDSPDECEDG